MNKDAISAVFRPQRLNQEAKADAITRNVRAILDAEATKRNTKTERLRAERLSHNAKAAFAAPALRIQSTARRGK